MEKESINKIKLGIFVTIGIVLLFAGIYFIGETKKIFSSTFRVSALFKDINGLQVGNNVRFAGINVGSVESIEIVTDSTVKVDIIIDDNIKKFIKSDAKATIGTEGLMGNKIVSISPGTNGKPIVENNGMIGATIPVNIDELLIKLKTTGDNASSIFSDLAAIMGNIRTGKGTIGKLFMDTVFAKNIDKTIINAKQGAKGFQENMDAASHNFLLRGFSDTPEEARIKKQKEAKELREEKKKAREEAKKDKKKK